MKTTVELPDSLMTQLKIIAAKEHRRLREVMEEVVSAGLLARERPNGDEGDSLAAAQSWLREWQELGRRVRSAAVDARPVVEILLADRR